MGILTNLRLSRTRGKRSTEDEGNGKQIAQILPNGNICFAGRKLPFRAPSNEDNAESLREALNTFIKLMSHRRGRHSGHFQSL